MKVIIGILTAMAITMSIPTQAANKHVHQDNLIVHSIGYDILKQKEKLIKDPTDIKEADLYKFKYICSDSYFNQILKSETKPKFRDGVIDTCETILKL